MTLSPIAYKFLEEFYLISLEIFNSYMKLSEMELSKNKMDFDKELNYLKVLASKENNLLLSIRNNMDFLTEIIEFLNKEKYCSNEHVNERMLLKLSNLLFDQRFKLLMLKNNLTLEESALKGKLMMIEMMDCFSKDIKMISTMYLNQAINNGYNHTFLKKFTDYKYKSLFIFLNNDLDLEKYLNIDEILLSFEVFSDFICIPGFIRELKINEEITEQLNIHINNLLDYSDEDLNDDDILANVYIIIFYIKSYMYFLDDNNKIKIMNDIKNKVSPSKSRKLLIDCIEDILKNPLNNVKKVRFKIK